MYGILLSLTLAAYLLAPFSLLQKLGPGLDPDGVTAPADAGPGLDPDGLTAPDPKTDAGPGLDPNGRS